MISLSFSSTEAPLLALGTAMNEGTAFGEHSDVAIVLWHTCVFFYLCLTDISGNMLFTACLQKGHTRARAKVSRTIAGFVISHAYCDNKLSTDHQWKKCRFEGHVRTVSATERRRYICNVFSHWLKPYSCDTSDDSVNVDSDHSE